MDSASVFMEKALTLIEQYVNTYGQALMGRYLFPAIPRNDFFTFLDCARVLMTRRGLCPQFAWIWDAEQNLYHVVLLCNGYGRSDLSDASDCWGRLWAIRTPQPFTCLSSVRIDAGHLGAVRHRFADDWGALMPRIKRTAWHQRTWGTSRLQPS